MNNNGLVTYTEQEIDYRDYLIKTISSQLRLELENINQAFNIVRCETSCLMSLFDLTRAYLDDERYTFSMQEEESLALRPETTKGTFSVAEEMLKRGVIKLPCCVWQKGKSFRKEQTSPTKHVKLKEFWQQEFQCVYGVGTKADYFSLMLSGIVDMFQFVLGTNVWMEDSDRIPGYSSRTVDIIGNLKGYSLELCSISQRHDFVYDVVEVAIGLDRCVKTVRGIYK